MAIDSVFSYRGKKVSLKSAVGAIVEQVSEKEMHGYVSGIDVHLLKLARTWRTWLRDELSKPIIKDKKGHIMANHTLWPRLRTGKLKRTIQRPEVISTKHTKPAASVGKGQHLWKFKLEGLFSRRGSKDHRPADTSTKSGISWDKRGGMLDDVGRYLNEQRDKSFGRWQDRAQRVLFLHTKARLLRRNSRVAIPSDMKAMSESRSKLGWS